MKQNKQLWKTIGIVVIPYLPLLFYLILTYQNYLYNEQTMYSSGSDTSFYDMMNRIQFLYSMLKGALFAGWFALVYSAKRKSTVIAVLVNLGIMLCMVVYSLYDPQEYSNSIDLVYVTLHAVQSDLLFYIGLHIYALIFLFLSKSSFENDTIADTNNPLEKDPTPDLSNQDMAVVQKEVLEDEIIVPKETKKHSLPKPKSFQTKPVESQDDSEEWKPKDA